MSQWSEDILTLTSSTNKISFSLLNRLLNFFDKHKKDLDFQDVKLIVDKSEEYRLYLNEHSSYFID